MDRRRSRPGRDQGNLFQDLGLIPVEPRKSSVVEEPKILSNEDIDRKIQEIRPLIYKNEKVLTFEMVDEIHGSPGNAKQAFNRHCHQMYEDHDYFRVPAKDSKSINLIPLEKTHSRGRDRILLTEWGYHLVIRSFRDQRSWEIYRIVLKGYFKSKQLETDEDKAIWLDATKTDERIRVIVAEREKSILQTVKGWIDHGFDQIRQAMCKGFSETKAIVSEVQHRKEPSAATQDELLQVLLGPAYEGKCPCCMERRILDQYGNRTDSLNFDHWYSITRYQAWEMWPVCDKCNLDLRDQKFKESHETYFKSFQRRREEMLEGQKPTLPFDGK